MHIQSFRKTARIILFVLFALGGASTTAQAFVIRPEFVYIEDETLCSFYVSDPDFKCPKQGTLDISFDPERPWEFSYYLESNIGQGRFGGFWEQANSYGYIPDEGIFTPDNFDQAVFDDWLQEYGLAVIAQGTFIQFVGGYSFYADTTIYFRDWVYPSNDTLTLTVFNNGTGYGWQDNSNRSDDHAGVSFLSAYRSLPRCSFSLRGC